MRGLRTKSLRETAKDLGCSAMYLSEVERGLKLPSKELRKRIEGYYGVDLAKFWRKTEISKLRCHIAVMQVKLKDLMLLDELEGRAE